MDDHYEPPANRPGCIEEAVKPESRSKRMAASAPRSAPSKFTALQGQYLVFIRAYTLIHRQPPAEADMERFFRVTPPSVHQMVLTLERLGALSRGPGKARSIRILLPPEEVPQLAESSADEEGA